MSNPLYITVGQFSRLGSSDQDYNVVVLASDSYGNEALTFDDEAHFLECYPTKEELTEAVLKLPSFEGAAVFNADGTYELDAVSDVIIQGYPQ